MTAVRADRGQFRKFVFVARIAGLALASVTSFHGHRRCSFT
jgi:hypothetical protein